MGSVDGLLEGTLVGPKLGMLDGGIVVIIVGARVPGARVIVTVGLNVGTKVLGASVFVDTVGLMVGIKALGARVVIVMGGLMVGP